MKMVPATHEDIPELISLIQYSFRGDRGWTRDDHLLEGVRVTREMLEENLTAPTSQLMKYLDDKDTSNPTSRPRIVATVHMERLPEKNMLYVGRLCVHPDFQNRGLGKNIMKAVEDRARELKCCAITFSVVYARIELIEWYQRQGFRLTGERVPLENEVYGHFKVAPDLLDLMKLQKDL